MKRRRKYRGWKRLKWAGLPFFGPRGISGKGKPGAGWTDPGVCADNGCPCKRDRKRV